MQRARSTMFPGDCFRYDPGETILKEGQGSNFIYILTNGTLGVYKGETKVSDITGRGTVFGEMSSILGMPRTCTVKADTESEVVVYRGGIDGILKKFPSITQKILRTMAERLVNLDDGYSEIQQRFDSLQEELEKTKQQLEEATREKQELRQVADTLDRAGDKVRKIREMKRDSDDHFRARISDEDLEDVSAKGLFKKGWKSKDLEL